MTLTFTCPHCGRNGSVSKEVPSGAKLRCPGCQKLFSPTVALEPALVGKFSEGQLDEFLGIDPNGLPPPDLPLQDQKFTESLNLQQSFTPDPDVIQPQHAV